MYKFVVNKDKFYTLIGTLPYIIVDLVLLSDFVFHLAFAPTDNFFTP